MNYKNRYNKENYDCLACHVPKGKGQIVKDTAKYEGMSVSQLIVRALELTYSINLSKEDKD